MGVHGYKFKSSQLHVSLYIDIDDVYAFNLVLHVCTQGGVPKLLDELVTNKYVHNWCCIIPSHSKIMNHQQN